MKVSDYIAQFLKEAGCTHVFGFPGGAVTHLIDSLYRCPGIRFIGVCHEQAAAFAAEGYARMKNDLGVAIATSGPGATNLITGIGSAWFDSVPCLYITGQVNTYEYKGGSRVRQLGFQETDIVSIVQPITKYAARVTQATAIRYEMEKAVAIARSGRRGPVLLDIPMDIQRAEVDVPTLAGYTGNREPQADIPLEAVLEQLNRCSRPVILAGGGVRLSGAVETLRQVAEGLRIPVVSSLMGRDAFDNASPLWCGMIGTYGNRYANLAVANSDLVLALGTRLDTRQTGTEPASFARGAKLIRVDVDGNELEHKIKPDEIAVHADGSAFLGKLAESLGQVRLETSAWLDRIQDYKSRYPTRVADEFPDPNHIMEVISDCLGPRDAVCLDVGQNQMWAAQSLRITAGQRLLTSGGMGAMGFALPCAAGVWYSGAARVLALCGDGGMQMNIQELGLIAREHIPVQVVVLNNRSLGMIRQFQEQYFDSRFVSTVVDYAAPDFCAIAEAYGIKSRRIENEDDLSCLKQLLTDGEPAVIEIMLRQDTHVYPKLSVHRPVEEQEPLLEISEWVANMIVPPYSANGAGAQDALFYRQFIRETFDGLKRNRAEDKLWLFPIQNDQGVLCGYLRPITADYRESMPFCAARLARWRNENQQGLSAQPFTATAEGTEKWIDCLVLNREDRILFLIMSADGAPVGHIGYSCFDYAAKRCDVDAVLRGEKGTPGMMSFALRALIQWGLSELKLSDIRLRVFSDNQRAIDFYLRNGFVVEDAPDSGQSGTGRHYLGMRLDMDAWDGEGQL